MSEYELLRAEILNAYDTITQYNCVLFTAVAAILAFALERNNFLLYLAPYLVILPIHFMCEDRYKTMCKMGAYMYVFLEGERYHWENRTIELTDRIAKNGNWMEESRIYRIHIHYYILPVICSISSSVSLLCSQRPLRYKVSFLLGIIVFSGIALCFLITNTTHFPKTRKYYIEQWTKIKANEKAKEYTENVVPVAKGADDDGDELGV